MKNSVKTILSVFMTAILIFGVTACKGAAEEAAIPMLTENAPAYDEVKQKIDVFDEVYANYCYNKQDELQFSRGEGFTPLGNSCYYTYATNIEGTNKADTVKSCTLEITHDDGSMIVDEYFAVDSTTMFIARTTVPADGSLGEVFKYVVVNNDLYEVNEQEATLTAVEKADTLDLYLTFAEIKELYGSAT